VTKSLVQSDRLRGSPNNNKIASIDTTEWPFFEEGQLTSDHAGLPRIEIPDNNLMLFLEIVVSVTSRRLGVT
jgi:hypothetical protein